METVQNNFMEIPHREINGSIWNDNADDQREMQAMMFSIDTTQPSASGSTIDTATGSKIEFYENNVVINKARIRFENFLAKLGEKILYAMVENMGELDNLYTRVDKQLIAIHKSQIEKSLNDMEINIEI
jgi:RNA binding exosome subunit